MITNVGIREIILKFKNSGKNKIFKLLDENNFSEYAYGELSEIISSFIDHKFCDFLTIPQKNDKNSREYKNWIIIHENEIRERLIRLMKMFGSKILKFMDIPIISNVKFDMMTYDEKVNYYHKCTNKLSSSVKTIREMASKQKKLYRVEASFSNDYDLILNPIESSSDSSEENSATGLLNIDFLLNDLVNKYFN
jgi:hypothetical protein